MPFFHWQHPRDLVNIDSISTPDYIQFDTSATFADTAGRLGWTSTNGAMRLGLVGGEVGVDLGEQLVTYCINKDTVTINRGDVVYLSGAQGDRPAVKLAANTGDLTSATTFGVVMQTILPNELGYVMNKGSVGNLSLGAYTTGDIIYLGATPGSITKTKPVAPAHGVFLGVILRANNGNGQIYVNPQNGYELNELHNVLLNGSADGDVLTYDSATSLWKNKQPTFSDQQRLFLQLPTNAIDVPPRTQVASNFAVVAGNVYYHQFTATRNMTISQITMQSAGTASSGLTLCRMGLYTASDTGATLVARTASDTTLFNSTFTQYTRSFDTTGGYPATYSLTAGSRYAIAVVATGTTMPTLYVGTFVPATMAALTPRTSGIQTGQTDLPTTQTGFSNTNVHCWGRLS
jgi:hypothetical protein